MGNEKKIRAHYLSDLPVGKDHFSGAHDRIANTITDLFYEQDGGIAIGLEGQWGSGKSTIVELIRKTISEKSRNGSCSLFVFDAWAHEGDPLRRTFLENLIKHLLSLNNWIDPKEWNFQLKQLSGKVKKVDSATKPHLGDMGKLVLFFVVISPIALGLINAGLRIWVPPSATEKLPYNWLLISGTSIYFTLLTLMYRKAKKDGFDKLAFLIKSVESESRTLTIEFPDPTSVEFETIFKKLIRNTLSKDRNRRLAIILDNLDRVSPSNALSILSTLQTYLQPSELNTDDDNEYVESKKRMYILIPYDPVGMKKIWDRNNNDNIGETMLDKKFHIRFDVPPLILSNIREYFLALLKEAFPNHENFSEFIIVFNIFRLMNIKEGGVLKVNPRDIKIFINQMVSIVKQWDDYFSLPSIAYYVSSRRNDPKLDFRKELLDKEYKLPDFVSLHSDNIKDDLAALWFNVKRDLARELLLKEPLIEGLKSNDTEILNDLVSLNRNIWPVLESIFYEFNQHFPSLDEISNIIWIMNESNLIENGEKEVLSKLHNKISESTNRLQDWPLLNSMLADKLAISINEVNDSALTDICLKKLLFTDGNIPENDDYSNDEISEWVKGCVRFLNSILKNNDLDISGIEDIFVPNGAITLIDACFCFHSYDQNGEYWSKINSNSEEIEITKNIGEIIKDGSLYDGYEGSLDVLKKSKLDLNWDEIIINIRSRMVDHLDISEEELIFLFDTIFGLQNYATNIENTLSTMSKNGTILHYLHKLFSIGNWKYVAYCFYVLFTENPTLVRSEEKGSSGAGFNNLKSVYTSPSSHKEIADEFNILVIEKDAHEIFFILISNNNNLHGWTCYSLMEFAKTNAILIDTSKVIENWPVFIKSLDETQLTNFLSNLKENTNLQEDINSRDFDIKYSGLYSYLIQIHSAKDTTFRNLIKKGLRGIKKEQWIQHINSNSFTIRVLLGMIDLNYKMDLGVDFKEALSDLVKSVLLEDMSEINLSVEEFNKLPIALKEHLRKNLKRSIRIHAENHKNPIPSKFFELFGDEILDHELLKESDGVINLFFIPLIIQRNYDGLLWLERLININVKEINNYKPKEYVQEMKDRLSKSVEDDPNDESSPIIKRIAIALGIESANKSEASKNEEESQ